MSRFVASGTKKGITSMSLVPAPCPLVGHFKNVSFKIVNSFSSSDNFFL
jgi:hypothetical protein